MFTVVRTAGVCARPDTSNPRRYVSTAFAVDMRRKFFRVVSGSRLASEPRRSVKFQEANFVQLEHSFCELMRRVA